jgi:hypothetical protein
MAKNGKKPIPKTQKQISKSLQQPYDQRYGNPNDLQFDPENRGNHVSFRDDTVKPFSLGLYDIDEAVLYYVENIIKPTVIQNGVVQKVPVIYGSAERWKQMQKDGYYRDKNGALMMPIIVFKRNNIEKDRSMTNKLDANFPNNINVFAKTYSQKDEYNNFDVLNNRKPKKEYYAVVVPDYVTITYDFIISTYYVEQMNKIVEAMNYASDAYWGNPERFKFRARIDSFGTAVELNAGTERLVKTQFTVTLRGYIVPDNVQKQLASIKKFSNAVQLIFQTETTSNIDDVTYIPPARTSIPDPTNPTQFED